MKKTGILFYEDGSYKIPHIDQFSNLYFPLFNYFGMKSAITPTLHGDIKIDQNHFGMIPSSGEDLKNPLNARNIFFRVDGTTWNVTGLTPYQKQVEDDVTLENGLLYQKIKRRNTHFEVEITSFVPSIERAIELHKVIFRNTSNIDLSVKPVVGIPIFGRSADNLRDHRHVTSLLNRVYLTEYGVINQPTLSFDERGHQENHYAYGVFAKSNLHSKVKHYWPILQEFLGEGSDMFYPSVVAFDQENDYQVGDIVEGFEAIGGLEFEEIKISPNQELELIVSFEIHSNLHELISLQKEMNDICFNCLFEETKNFWKKDFETSYFTIGDKDMSGWYRQVGIQPLVRRIYGNSFLPHHDYGRGGRGWRDLWQDSLALILKNPSDVRSNIINYFKGVRIDGSNATIIGDKPGEFLADRNKIVRVWSDHGAWPFITVDFYIQRTGDINILLEKQGYFKDKFTHYTKQIDSLYKEEQGKDLLKKDGSVYQGTILEHILVQNLAAYYNVGLHGNIRIEDADWNDGFDMASLKGETVAFTHLYIGNLRKMIELLLKLKEVGHTHITVFEEFQYLMNKDQHKGLTPTKKQEKLAHFFDQVTHQLSGKTLEILIEGIVKDLELKIDVMMTHLNLQEWMSFGDLGTFNGYYDKFGNRVESLEDPVKLMLTSQVFPLMAHNASAEQIQKIYQTSKKYLYSDEFKSYRLNTPFGENKMNLGRFMGFAYGHKENGAFFSHMTMMFAYALLDNGYTLEGTDIIDDYIHYLLDINRSKILPGIPEYIDPTGRGMYHFLTGSASWVVITLVEQIFGVKARFGDLVLSPHLRKRHFDLSDPSLNIILHGKKLNISYQNTMGLEYGEYHIEKVILNKTEIKTDKYECIIPKENITEDAKIIVILGGDK
ncbi:MAG: cellobiose phosphorylase [Candidatus Izemoplasmatales bacterium]